MHNHYEFDITAVLIAHRESWMVHPSIISMQQSRQYAELNGLSVESLIILDNTDTLTVEFINANKSSDTRVEYTTFAELSSARNHAVNLAKGKFVAFLDGDDIWCSTWLFNAFNAASKLVHPAAFHPEANIYFDNENFLLFRRDIEDDNFFLSFLNYTSCWSPLSFSSREIYRQYPYSPNHIEKGFGYEDWQWNCETVKGGILHKVVKGTTHFIRRKNVGSLEEKTRLAGCLMTPSTLFLRRKPPATDAQPD